MTDVGASLLDVNVLIALLDPDHIGHARARAWFAENAAHGWATCPITENGAVRVISQPRYPNPLAAGSAIALLARAKQSPHHRFWPDSVSLLDPAVADHGRIHGPRQLTDVYLLALAVANAGRLVSFDNSIPLSAVRGAGTHNLVVL